jgi:hypothetical protein
MHSSCWTQLVTKGNNNEKQTKMNTRSLITEFPVGTSQTVELATTHFDRMNEWIKVSVLQAVFMQYL